MCREWLVNETTSNWHRNFYPKLNRLEKPLLVFKLRLNLDKVKSMLISRKRNQHVLNLSVNPTVIKVSKSTALLGVTISKDLSWCTHIQQVCAR